MSTKHPPADAIYERAMARSTEIKREVAKQQIARVLDLAVLKPTATREDVIQAAELVEEHDIASVCVAPSNIMVAKRRTDRVCAVIGFPHGNTLIEIKQCEARRAITYGAVELDVVINYGRFLAGHWTSMRSELRGIVEQAHVFDVKVKATLETCYYTPLQIVEACELCVSCGVDWVTTSTGFGLGGAALGSVALMLKTVEGKAQVKASGGINNYTDARLYLDMGCTRIGSSKFHELLP
jgi:deoxyribose-phosphate aldolase